MTIAMTPALAALLAAGAGPGPGVTTEWLYHGVDRPVEITVTVPAGGGEAALVLLDAQGDPIAGPVNAEPGAGDLAALMPEIWMLERAAWLQLVIGEDPVGAPLVVQPMLSRLVPIVEEAVNPDGIRYTRIVGWRHELDPIASDKPGKRDEPAEPPRRRLTGVRTYLDRDVVLQTSKGPIRLAMRPDEAPNTAWNFLELCRGGFYRGVEFHRVVPFARNGDPFVIQAGDPTGIGDGGPGYWLPIEPSELPHEFGAISMARDVPPDSAGSQFFICLSREGTARLDGHYCAFGYAVAGAETIRAIAAVELDDPARGRPADPPVILRAELIEAPPRRPGEGRPDRRVSDAPPDSKNQLDRVPR